MFRIIYTITALLIAMIYMAYEFENIELKVIAALLLLLWIINIRGAIKSTNMINTQRWVRENQHNELMDQL